jgi:hypothetical protein
MNYEPGYSRIVCAHKNSCEGLGRHRFVKGGTIGQPGLEREPEVSRDAKSRAIVILSALRSALIFSATIGAGTYCAYETSQPVTLPIFLAELHKAGGPVATVN